MKDDKPIDRDLLARYLLGQPVEPDEANLLEAQYFGNESALLQIEDLEDELIDRYVMNDLPPDQLDLVRLKIDSSGRWKEKHELARRLRAAALRGIPDRAASDAAPRAAWRFGLGARHAAWGAALVSTIVIGLTLWTWRPRPAESPALPGAPEGRTEARLPSPRVVTVALGSPQTRNGRAPTIEVSLPNTDVLVEFRIWLGVQRYEAYRALLSQAATQAPQLIPDSRIRTEKSSVAGHTVFVGVRSALLPSGAHELVLEGTVSQDGWETVRTYTIHVGRQ